MGKRTRQISAASVVITVFLVRTVLLIDSRALSEPGQGRLTVQVKNGIFT
jgi:hypothetical protein